MSTSDIYLPWDREEKLGPPPWSPDDPQVIAWEKAHGHDVRLKCYPEFGCQVRDLTGSERKAVVMALEARMRDESGTFYELLRRAVERLGGPRAIKGPEGP